MAASTNVYVLPDQDIYNGGKIYDRWGNLSYFADVDSLADEVTDGGADSVFEVGAHSRLPYINSKAEISVKKHDRAVVTGVRQTKGALPGKVFTLQDDKEMRDFTTTATLSAVYTWLKKEAKVNLTMYSDKGTPYDPIPKAEAAA